MNKAIPAVLFPMAVITLAVIAIPGINNAWADWNDPHRCGTGDCVPPVLGYHTRERAFIEGGFSINGQTFDVPQRIFQIEEPFNVDVGQQNTISLIVYENVAGKFLENANLIVGDSSIQWHKAFNQEESVNVVDKEGIFESVQVRARALDDWTHEVSFSFRFPTAFEPKTLEVTTWDFNRNVARYFFHNGISSGQTAADLAMQEPDSICGEGLNLYFKEWDDNPVCLTEASAEKLLARNWVYA